MAQDWAGFSEEELRRLRQSKDSSGPPRRFPTKKSRQQLQRERALKEQSQGLGLCHGDSTVLPRLSYQHSCPSPSAPPDTTTLPSGTGDEKPKQHQLRDPGPQNSCEGPTNDEVCPPQPDCKSETKKVELQEKSRWEVLHQEQRLMEEKNKRKKALLAKAIAERSERTQAETLKLKRIQKELQALDDMVSADIGILRNRIDQASLDYSHARKRFDRAEAEYVAAKLDLQRKTETKEQLTEHLCTIIQQNELRKAKKLEELMLQLEVQADETLDDPLQAMDGEVGAQLCPDRPTPSSTRSEALVETRELQAQGDEQGKGPHSISLAHPEHPQTAAGAL